MSVRNLRKQEVRRAVDTKCPGEHRSGGEENFPIYIDGKWVSNVTVPLGSGPLLPGTAHSIRKQLKLTTPQFTDFVKCPLRGPAYEQLLREKREAGLI